MRTRFLSVLACCVLAVPVSGSLAGGSRPAAPVDDDANTASRGTLLAGIGSRPVRFEPNTGQADPRTRFLARTAGSAAFLTGDGLVLAMTGEPAATDLCKGRGTVPEPVVGAVTLGLRGGDMSGRIETGERLPGVSNYLRGDPSEWRTRVPAYASIRLKDVYPGVDLVLHGERGRIEYDFELVPGADPGRILVECESAEPAVLEADGSITVTTVAGVLRQAPPVASQPSATGPVSVASRFVQRGAGLFGFEMGALDRQLPLTIDPSLSLSTYLGGNGADSGYGVAVDATGRFYVCGYTLSSDFPVVYAIDGTPQGNFDAFVTKYTEGPQPVYNYSTYLGGSLLDVAFAIAVDEDENAYVAGATSSTDFPTVNPLELDPGDSNMDAFVVKLNSEGDAIVFATYLGGFGSDRATDIAVGPAGSMFVTGSTESTDFPVISAVQTSFGGGATDAFVTEIGPSASSAVYSTFLGGSQSDVALGVAVDASGAAYVTGNTASNDFPVVAAKQPAIAGGIDAFVTRIGPNGTAIVTSTYLGGTGNDAAGRVAVDAAGTVVTGYTASLDFPTKNALYPDQSDLKLDVYVTRYTPTGTDFAFSTYLGGNGDDLASDVAIGQDGNIYVIGSTTSTNFPTENPIQFDGDGATFDAYITEFNGAGTEVLFSTYLGGGLDDAGVAIAVSGSDVILAAGQTLSTNFPMSATLENDPGDSNYDAFVVRIGAPVADTRFSAHAVTPTPLVRDAEASYDATIANGGPDLAGDVTAIMFVEDTTVTSVDVSQGEATVIPVSSTSEAVRCRFGRLAAGAGVTIHVDLNVNHDAEDTVHVFGYLTTSAQDSDYANNEYFETAAVVSITPPDITGVQSLVTAGKPYRIRITGANFQPGIEVRIAMDPAPWPTVKYKGVTTLVMKGAGLKQRFPKGVGVPLQVRNPDGGLDSFVFTR